jgi:hypothetical protein
MMPNPAFQATLRIKPRKSPELYDGADAKRTKVVGHSRR